MSACASTALRHTSRRNRTRSPNMQLEELQTIWETQTEQPVFTVNNFGLHLALYQDRERARRRLFWGGYFINFVVSVLALVGLLVMYVVFFFKKPVDDVLMTGWD